MREGKVEGASFDGTSETGRAPRRPLRVPADARIIVVALVIFVLMSFASPRFLTSGNLYNLLDQSVVVGIVAIGQTFVVLVAGIDLSVGAVTGVAGIVFGTLVAKAGLPMSVGVPVTILAATALGLLNGCLVNFGRIAPFIVTLGTMSICRSAAYLISDGNSISNLPDSLSALSVAEILGAPVNFLFLLALFALAWWYLQRTKGGRTIYATGSNRDAAIAAGLRTTFYSNVAYAVSGASAGLAAVLLSSRLMSIDPLAGNGLELDAIAAVVIGGASLFGGRGSMPGTLFGVFIMVLIRNGLNLLGVGPYWQGTAIGTIILVAVLIERMTSGTRR
ncbi:ABC transporter permease [Paraburkholderia acidisoli]|uniref:ABC transporter permease n=1 Tax=Paraburkholderia acidisoli TaxID=2571748 RepID=A0A7Z2JJS2_9BURK|nr:ABC transporter permease [Paraburkholderia acidisoli]QGZ65589.1 ABC transporter permease [Paraburkholderia acidisoli]